MGMSNRQKQERYRARKRLLEDEVRRLTGLAQTDPETLAAKDREIAELKARLPMVDDAEAAEDREIAKMRNDESCRYYPGMPFSDIKTIGELRNYVEKAFRRGVSPDAEVFYTTIDKELDEIESTSNILCSFNDDDGPDCPPLMIIEKSDEDASAKDQAATIAQQIAKLKEHIAKQDEEIQEAYNIVVKEEARSARLEELIHRMHLHKLEPEDEKMLADINHEVRLREQYMARMAKTGAKPETKQTERPTKKPNRPKKKATKS
jgi:hypothetical protein